MKVVISSGHSTKCRGASGYIDEVVEATKVVDQVGRILNSMEDVQAITYHDTISTTQNENLNRIVDFHNTRGEHDLDISVHFNAYQTTSKPMGCEVLYLTMNGLADELVDAMCAASGLINRGPKHRGDLFFLNNTAAPAVLIEVCFVDSKADVDIYQRKFGEICDAIARVVAGEEAEAAPPPVAEAPPADRRELSEGMAGGDVAYLQRVLGLDADGEFGEITETQVEAFQAACDLHSDGIVGPLTWEQVDDLERRKRNGEPFAGLSREQAEHIMDLAEDAVIMDYYWPDRGIAPPGYIPGMALCFAAALKMLGDDGAAAVYMAQADTGEETTDALAWYRDEFEAHGMHNDEDGPDTLRHLFVMLIGLGMRESSGRWCEGRDLSADNVEADTAEAGLFQTSWNISNATDVIPPLLEDYWDDPNGFLDEFRRGVNPTAENLSCYGSGEGARYQFLSRYCPLFAVMTTGVGLRKLRQHWGPINRREVKINPDADRLLRDVQEYLESVA